MEPLGPGLLSRSSKEGLSSELGLGRLAGAGSTGTALIRSRSDGIGVGATMSGDGTSAVRGSLSRSSRDRFPDEVPRLGPSLSFKERGFVAIAGCADVTLGIEVWLEAWDRICKLGTPFEPFEAVGWSGIRIVEGDAEEAGTERRSARDLRGGGTGILGCGVSLETISDVGGGSFFDAVDAVGAAGAVSLMATEVGSADATASCGNVGRPEACVASAASVRFAGRSSGCA